MVADAWARAILDFSCTSLMVRGLFALFRRCWVFWRLLPLLTHAYFCQSVVECASVLARRFKNKYKKVKSKLNNDKIKIAPKVATHEPKNLQRHKPNRQPTPKTIHTLHLPRRIHSIHKKPKHQQTRYTFQYKN